MPSADNLVRFLILLWFSFGILAGFALFIDRFLIPFYQDFNTINKHFSLDKPNTNILSNSYFILFGLLGIFLLFGLLGIYYTICTLLSLTSNKFLLIVLTILTVFLQITFIDIILAV